MVEGGRGDRKTPLLPKLPRDSDESEEEVVRTGTLWTVIAHVITAVIGSGVLSLAWSVAQLGWIAGPLALVIFAAVTVTQSSLLADCYRSPDPEYGHIRNHSYLQAVKLYLGGKSVWFCGFFQKTSLYGCAIAYTITSATSMRAIKKSDCYHKEGHKAPCAYGDSFYMLIFGAVQIVFSQIPDFHDMAWLSVVAAIMSFSYSFIGFALGIAKVIANGSIKGDIGGIPLSSSAQKTWRVSQALGDIAFAYPYSIILLEIQNTLKSPPPENQTMKKASMISIFITTFFYLCCGCFGYAAFGNDTPGNLLTGFGFYEPYWLIDFANACVVVHLVGGYQVYSQPVFSFVDRWSSDKFPNNGFVNNFYTIKLPFLPAYKLNLLRICFRTIYVASTTGLAMFFPYFNEVLGLLGAFNFWPLAIYFPVEMYFVQRKIETWTKKWIILQTFSVGCLLVSIFAFVGSVEGVLSEKLS
ncbi:probable amino acid permease 7 isoform X1 [Typha angustifolia]|uniref:probable amino acid permease 7 isoform X1 n=1 Tax=Typha angustifolia TaxID=59011 RepID=UPI003C2ADD57